MAAPLAGGRYRFQELLSATAMAEVWLALDTELERQVVVKLLATGADRTRFEREAQAVAGLSHPNIVQLFDFGDEGRPYMVFEYLSGGSLDDRLARGAEFPDGEVARIAKDVAEGLAHAHDHGVVHRDLKPGNILFDAEDRAKIADFGIARVRGTDTLTEGGTVLGTAAYISPEQVRGEPVTPASDVYSFGVILYRLLSGRLPFEADSATALAAMHRDATPVPLSADAEPERRLATVALSALSKEPAQRPADGSALLEAFEGMTPPVEATTQLIGVPGLRRGIRWGRPTIVGFAVVLLAAGGAVAAILLTSRRTSSPVVPARPPVQSSHRATTVSSTQQSSTTAGSTTLATTRPTTTHGAARTTTPTLSATVPTTVATTATVPPATTTGP